HRRQPRARVLRHACARPLLQRRDQRVLRQLLGEADVAGEQAGEPGDDARGLLPPDLADDVGRHAWSGPKTWYMIDSPPPSTSWKRRVSAIASSREGTSSSAKLTIASLVSANGPSVTVN